MKKPHVVRYMTTAKTKRKNVIQGARQWVWMSQFLIYDFIAIGANITISQENVSRADVLSIVSVQNRSTPRKTLLGIALSFGCSSQRITIGAEFPIVNSAIMKAIVLTGTFGHAAFAGPFGLDQAARQTGRHLVEWIAPLPLFHGVWSAEIQRSSRRVAAINGAELWLART